MDGFVYEDQEFVETAIHYDENEEQLNQQHRYIEKIFYADEAGSKTHRPLTGNSTDCEEKSSSREVKSGGRIGGLKQSDSIQDLNSELKKLGVKLNQKDQEDEVEADRE